MRANAADYKENHIIRIIKCNISPFDPGYLNTFTIAAVTLKEHDLIDKKHKRRKSGKFSVISLGSNRAGRSRG